MSDWELNEDKLEAGIQLFRRMLNHPDWQLAPYPVFGPDSVSTVFSLWDWLINRIRQQEEKHDLSIEIAKYAEIDSSTGESTGYTEYSLVVHSDYEGAWAEMQVTELNWLDEWRKKDQTPVGQIEQRIVALIVAMSDRYLGCSALNPYFEDMALSYFDDEILEQTEMLNELEAKWKESQSKLVNVFDRAENGGQNQLEEEFANERDEYCIKIQDMEDARHCYRHKTGDAVLFAKWFDKQTFKRDYDRCNRMLKRLLRKVNLECEYNFGLRRLVDSFWILEEMGTKSDGTTYTMDDFIQDRNDEYRNDERGLNPVATHGFWYSLSDALGENMCEDIDVAWQNYGVAQPEHSVDLLDPKQQLPYVEDKPHFPVSLVRFMQSAQHCFSLLTAVHHVNH